MGILKTSATNYAIRVANAQSGNLTTAYDELSPSRASFRELVRPHHTGEKNLTPEFTIAVLMFESELSRSSRKTHY